MRYAERLRQEQLAGKLIDVHSHSGGMDLSNFYKGLYPTTQDILDLEDKGYRAGVDLQVVFPMCTTIYYDIPAYWREHTFKESGYCAYPFQLENQRLLECVSYFGLKRLLPFLCFSLRAGVTEQEASIVSLAEKFPVYGLKYHTKVDQCAASEIDRRSRFTDIAKLLNVPIMVHTEEKGCSSAMELLSLAQRHPEVRFCAAHLGGFSRAFFRALEDYPWDNLYVDCSPLVARCRSLSRMTVPDTLLDLDYSNPAGVLGYFLHTFPGRILWGTDAPWTSYGHLDDGPGDHCRDGYAREAGILRASGAQEQVSRNTVRYLLGIG